MLAPQSLLGYVMCNIAGKNAVPQNPCEKRCHVPAIPSRSPSAASNYRRGQENSASFSASGRWSSRDSATRRGSAGGSMGPAAAVVNNSRAGAPWRRPDCEREDSRSSANSMDREPSGSQITATSESAVRPISGGAGSTPATHRSNRSIACNSRPDSSARWRRAYSSRNQRPRAVSITAASMFS